MKITKAKLKQIIKEELSKVLSEGLPPSWSVWFRTPHEGAMSYDFYADEFSLEKVRAELKAANSHFPPAVEYIATVNDQSDEIVNLSKDFSKEDALAAIEAGPEEHTY